MGRLPGDKLKGRAMPAAANPTLSLEEIRKLALPLRTRILSGEGLLDRPIAWTTVLHPEENLQAKSLQPQELLLIARARRHRGGMKDHELLQWAAARGAAAALFCDSVSTAALAEAKALQLPVLAVPPDIRVRDVERAVISLLVNRKGLIERRGTQIYRQLTQISSRNEGLNALVEAIARLSKKTVILQDKRLQPISQKLQPQFIGSWDAVDAFLKKHGNLPIELHDRHRVAEVEPPVLMQALPAAGVARLVAPIVTKSVGRGYLSIVGRERDLDEVDQLVCEHGAAACALEMAKQKAISDAEKRLRGTFLDRLLLGDISAQEAIRHGKRFKHDMTQTHVALVLAWRGPQQPSLRRLETTVNSVLALQDAAALVWMRRQDQQVAVFHSADHDNPIDDSLELAQAIRDEVARQFSQQRVAIGLGQVARELKDWRTSYRDAVQAMALADRLQTDIPLFIGDLGVYQLILTLNEREKLSDFCEATLGTITKYDRRQNSDLMRTLEVYFNCHGNLSQTAEALIIHRNTLLYRINRINEIAGIDLSRPETRLALHLALTIRRLLAMA